MAKENKLSDGEEQLPPPLPKTDNPPSDLLPVEQHATAQSTPDWLFAAAKHKHKWVIGQYISLPDYDTAIESTKNEAVK